MTEYSLWCVDVETNGLDSRVHSPIEISLYTFSREIQKTWFLKPLDIDHTESQALKINGHKMEDISGNTKYGRETYSNPIDVLAEIENFVNDDEVPSKNRCLVGQNVSFDKDMLEQLWTRCNQKDSFPFGRRYMDTMIVELFIDHCHSKVTGQNKMAEGYSLANLVKKYGVTNTKAHSSTADVKATKEVFEKQVEFFYQVLSRALYNQDEGLIRRAG